jgi:8-oxo-dGTP diphosphatase
MEPRIRVSAILRRDGRVLLCRQEKAGDTYWLLPGGGVEHGESLAEALQRELREELGLTEKVAIEGPVCVVDSIAPEGRPAKHVVHIVFAGDLGGRSLEKVASSDAAVRGHRLFGAEELAGLPLHPPIHRFLAAWEPGDPTVYLGALWAP